MYNEEWGKNTQIPDTFRRSVASQESQVALTWARQLNRSPQYLISAKTVKLPEELNAFSTVNWTFLPNVE